MKDCCRENLEMITRDFDWHGDIVSEAIFVCKVCGEEYNIIELGMEARNYDKGRIREAV